jgi:hypothetical protein
MLRKIFKKENLRYEEIISKEIEMKSQIQCNSSVLRTDIINYLVSEMAIDELNYLEIGVRHPSDNFDKINAKNKFGVDPGVENLANPVDFKMTSNEFFEKMRNKKIFPNGINFHIIFIDGLHLSFQAYEDIINSLEFLDDNGFIVIHDCNPPSEFHARENANYDDTPASIYWNGTTWKSFSKIRELKELSTFCIDTDWGVGIISKRIGLSKPNIISNNFFEFSILEKNRVEILNLMSFSEFKAILGNTK